MGRYCLEFIEKFDIIYAGCAAGIPNGPLSLERRIDMNLSVFLNSKFAVALVLVIPAVILAAKMPVKDATEAFNHMIDASKNQFKAVEAKD